MRKLLFAGSALSAVFVGWAAEVRAVEYPWCVIGERRSMECVFSTREQCVADSSRGFGGGCLQNPFYHGARAALAGPEVRVRPDHVRHKSHHHAVDR
jgi:Protein of unknown function (DUF3551)